MTAPNRDHTEGEVPGRLLPIEIPEIQKMRRIISIIGVVNLLIGLPSVLLVMNLRSGALFATGLLSLLTYLLLRMTVKSITQARSWGEIGVLAICGMYIPGFIVWACGINLIEAILR